MIQLNYRYNIAKNTTIELNQIDSQKQLADTQVNAVTNVWKSMDTMTLNNLCSQFSTYNQPVSDLQAITSLTELQFGQLCNNVNSLGNFGKFSIPDSTSNIQTTQLTDNNNIIPYCSESATNQTSYQTSQCVCNQLGSNPILRSGTYKSGGIGGIGGTTTTGYYCSTN